MRASHLLSLALLSVLLPPIRAIPENNSPKQASPPLRGAEEREATRQAQKAEPERASGNRQEPVRAASQPQQRAQPGQYTSAKGTVTAVRCKGTAIELALDADGKALKLRADDYHKLELTALYGKILPGFNVCEHLTDLVVTAKYKPTEANAGQVIAIQLP